MLPGSLGRVLSPLAVFSVHASCGGGGGRGSCKSMAQLLPFPRTPASQPLGSWGLLGAWEGKRNCPSPPTLRPGGRKRLGRDQRPPSPTRGSLLLRFPALLALPPSRAPAGSLSPSSFGLKTRHCHTSIKAGVFLFKA